MHLPMADGGRLSSPRENRWRSLPSTAPVCRLLPAAPSWSQIAAAPRRFRVLTGDRATGPLHLGHYFGTLANRVGLPDAGVEILPLVVNYQVITDRDSVEGIAGAVLDLLADYLAAGIAAAPNDGVRPQRRVGAQPADAALPGPGQCRGAAPHHPVKAETEAAGDRALSGLLLTYPVHQAADILFCGALLRRQLGAGRPRSATAPGAAPHHRPPVQPALRRRRCRVPRAPRHCCRPHRSCLAPTGRR